MQNLNYKHLHYFWVVTRSGGVAKAGEQLHVTPQSISGQMRQLEATIGATLWRRAGRKLALTDTGQLVFEYADRRWARS
jgi:LysR family transcriptional regulator, transcriptional activator of nhaA